MANDNKDGVVNEMWENKEDARYAFLLAFLQGADEPGQHFDAQVEFVALRDKAIRCGLSVDPLPF